MTAQVVELLKRAGSRNGVLGLGGSPLGNLARPVTDD